MTVIRKIARKIYTMNLRSKLMFFFLITTGLPVLVSGFLTLSYFGSINKNNARSSLNDRLHNAQLLYERRRFDIEKTARLVASDNLVLVNLEFILYLPISNHLNSIIKTGNITFLSILGTDGKMIVSGNRGFFNPTKNPVFDSQVLQFAESGGSLNATMQIVSDEFNSIEGLKPVYGNSITAMVSIFPIRSYQKKLLGYVLCGYAINAVDHGSKSSLCLELKNGSSSQVIIFDQKSVLSYSDETVDFTQIEFPQTLYSELLNEPELFQEMKIDGTTFLFNCSAVDLYNSTSKLVLGVGIPESEFLKASRQAILFLLIMIFLSLGLAVAIGILLSESISKPVTSMVEGTRQIMEGNFNKKISIRSHDEIGVLAKSFNLMSEKLHRRINSDEIVSELSRKFINIPLHETDDALMEALERVAQFVKADRSYLFLFDDNSKTTLNAIEWHRRDVKSRRGTLHKRLEEYDNWLQSEIRKTDAIFITDPDQFPDEAQSERRRWHKEKIQTIVCIPLKHGNIVDGYIGFDFLHKTDALHDDLKLLRIVGEIICNTLERIQAEDRLTHNKNMLRNVFNAQSTLLVSIENNCIVSQWNTAAERYTGISSEDASGKEVWDCIPFLLAYKEAILNVIKKRKPVDLSREMITDAETQKKKYFNISFLPLSFSHDSGLLIKIDDITEEVKKDDQLIQIQKMETVRTLAGGLAHDFNNVIGAITATSSFLKYSLNNESAKVSDITEDLDIVMKSAFRAGEMVKQLLTMSRKQESEFIQVDLNQIIENVMKIGEHIFDKSVRIVLDLDVSPAIVYADYSQMEQVLLNMCINACHAMTFMRAENETHGGVLTISLKRTFVEENIHPEAKSGNYLLLKISDTGIGMDSDVLVNIFDPFFTTKDKSKGSGLGLAMVYNIIRQHNGFIDVYSEKNVGSSFIIFLPEVVSDDQVDTVYRRYPSKIYKGKGTILIIDDEAGIRNITRKILLQCGYKVIDC